MFWHKNSLASGCKFWYRPVGTVTHVYLGVWGILLSVSATDHLTPSCVLVVSGTRAFGAQSHRVGSRSQTLSLRPLTTATLVWSSLDTPPPPPPLGVV